MAPEDPQVGLSTYNVTTVVTSITDLFAMRTFCLHMQPLMIFLKLHTTC